VNPEWSSPTAMAIDLRVEASWRGKSVADLYRLGTNAVTGKRFIVSIDVEYLIEDEDAVHAAGSDSLGREGDLNERITQLVADRITGQALDFDRAVSSATR